MEECKEGLGDIIFHKYLNIINIQNLTNDKKYTVIIEYLLQRYHCLHKGEISSFFLAFLKYELNDFLYYFFTLIKK